MWLIAEQRDMLERFDRRHRDPDRRREHSGLAYVEVGPAQVLTFSRDGTVRLWDPALTAPRRLLDRSAEATLAGDEAPAFRLAREVVAFARAGDWDALLGQVDGAYLGQPGRLELRTAFERLAALPSPTLSGMGQAADGTAWRGTVLADGERAHRLVVGADGGDPARLRAIGLDRMTDGQWPHTHAQTAAFSPDGLRVAVAFGDAVRVWDLDSPHRPLATLRHPSPPGIHRGVAFDPRDRGGGRLVFASGRDLVSVDVDGDDPPSVHRDALAGRAWALRAEPDGGHVIAASAGGVQRIDLDDLGAPPAVLASASSTAVAVSADGRLVAHADGAEVVLLDLADLDAEPVRLSGPAADVRSVAFSPDARRVVATAPRAETAWVWAVDGASPPRVLRMPDGAPIDAGFLDDGRLVVAGVDGWVRIVSPLEGVVRELCRRLGRSLTEDEWRAALGDAPYRASCDEPAPQSGAQ